MQKTDMAEGDIVERASKKAFENFWYYYKWHTIVGIFLVFCAVVIISQMAGRTTYDAHVMYTGSLFLDKETAQSMVDSIGEISKNADNAADADYTGDGELTVDLSTRVYISPELAEEYQEEDIYYNHVQNVATHSDFTNMLMIGEYVILLVDRSLYDQTVDAGAFLAWEETVGYTPDGAIDDYGIAISSLPLYEMNGFRQLPEDTVLCCRAKSYVNKFNKNVQNEELYKAELILFAQLITYQGN